ncbi:MAG: putative L,D-transpeptidase ErfK/SrfK precursor [Candidatus Accumulibacter appositus]|uniref:Putative L,D-transpeptidase ErfK/SrfK n=1 Tax=Candidatus Accumulibacter appositus TaxID=1454003 RepID=A0A011PXK7_9PROT|nr:L,D-transpeptidase family protein [Accumulibacter sp.]EXI81590.1 MAG: putative L,D-transpeptidase ErfK/SrfK precursor [Candidatus Accumulibacter appositus]HRF06846.1 L,D-transpeptidase family protein [Accumulibacter sp.]
MHRYLLLPLCALFMAGHSAAATFPLPPAGSDVVGEIEFTRASRADTLLDIARRHDIGQDEILLANPNVDRWLPAEGAPVTLPTRYILPRAERTGLVLNLPEMRLYYYPKPLREQTPLVITHPVSVGRMDWVTPLGKTTIVAKERDPSWRPPESVKEEHAREQGEILPDVVPAGPDNPLGRFAMRLGLPGYLIHSTNKPFGVGMRVTHGCIRMYPEDIERLFDLVPVRTQVQVVNQPIKVGWLDGALYVEVHPPMDEDQEKYEEIMNAASDRITQAIAETGNPQAVVLSDNAIRAAFAEKSGIPVMISESLYGGGSREAPAGAWRY